MNQKSRTRGYSDYEILRSITSLNLKKMAQIVLDRATNLSASGRER